MTIGTLKINYGDKGIYDKKTALKTTDKYYIHNELNEIKDKMEFSFANFRLLCSIYQDWFLNFIKSNL